MKSTLADDRSLLHVKVLIPTVDPVYILFSQPSLLYGVIGQPPSLFNVVI